MSKPKGFLANIQAGQWRAALSALSDNPGLANATQSKPPTATALHLATAAGHEEMAAALLVNGARINARNHEGRTPLHDSLESGQRAITELLLSNGAQVDICAAAILGDSKKVKQWLRIDPDLANDRDTNLSPLAWAAFGNQCDTARLLIDAGAAMDDDELICAAAVGHVEVGKLLINAGADPTVLSRQGYSALHAAATMRYTFDSEPFVKMLIEIGVDPRQLSGDHLTALEIARHHAGELGLPSAKQAGFTKVIATLEVALGS